MKRAIHIVAPFVGPALCVAFLAIVGCVTVPSKIEVSTPDLAAAINQPFEGKAPPKVIQSEQEPTPAIRIVGPSEAEPGQLVKLSAEGQGKWAWGASHDNALLEKARDYDTAENESRLFFSTPKPGSYVFWLAGSDSLVPHVLVVRGSDPVPPSPPGPIPPDPPGPLPPQTHVQILIVEETDQRTPELSRCLMNLRDGTAAQYIKGHGHTLRIEDDDAKDQYGKPSPFLAKYAPYNVPELLILGSKGEVLSRSKMPATADGVIEAVTRVAK